MKKFENKDILKNRVKTHPQWNVVVYDSKVFINKHKRIDGDISSTYLNHVPYGYINLYEKNVDKPASDVSYPFVIKSGDMDYFTSILKTDYMTASYGDIIIGQNPLSASITRRFFDTNASRPQIHSLLTTLDYYSKVSKHYSYSSSLGNKSTQALTLLSIPSIFYGSSIKKGSVDLGFYLSGALIARAQDKYENGEIIAVSGSGASTNEVIGVVLYKEGFILLTGSTVLEAENRDFKDNAAAKDSSKWLYFGAGCNDGNSSGILPYINFSLDFHGTNIINTLTMFATTKEGEENYSSNPTFLEQGQGRIPITSSVLYKENDKILIKNMYSSSYSDITGSYEKMTYISSINIYDKKKNLIGVARLANNTRKREKDSYTFKIKVDL